MIFILNKNQAATGTDAVVNLGERTVMLPVRTFQSTVSGTGAVTATVVIQVSNDGTNYLTLGTITLSGTTSASDGFASDASWGYVRANVTAISGTSAIVNTTMGA